MLGVIGIGWGINISHKKGHPKVAFYNAIERTSN